MTDQPLPTIDQIAAAVVSTARRRSGNWLFVGWTADGLPAATGDASRLSEGARQAVALNQGAGLPPRRVPYERVVPVEYVLTGSAIDYADTDQRRAEDQIRYTVTDATGEQREIALGELAVLGAIADTREPWQSMAGGPGTEVAVSAVALYTVFAPPPGKRPDTCVALLFRPTIPAAGNEAAFGSFARQSISRLLILDESQPPERRKGYLRVAGRLAGTSPKGGLASTLVWLRRVGLVDFSDPWLQDMRSTGRRAQGHLARLLRAAQLVDISDDVLEELAHPRPDYDIDPLETEQLFHLAEGMYEVARKALR